MSDLNDKMKQSEIPHWFSYGTIGIFLMLLGAIAVVVFSAKKDITEINSLANTRAVLRLDTETGRYLLKNGLPILGRTAGEEDPVTIFHFNWIEVYWKLAANIRQATPQEILKAQFPLLALTNPKPKPYVPLPSPPAPITEPPVLTEENLPLPKKLPEVLIYHTHTSESYLPVSGKDHKTDQPGDIVLVGRYLYQLLRDKYQFSCIHTEKIHDHFPFRESYQRSQVTLVETLKEYPSLQVLLDIHRDATPGLATTCSIKGEQAATLMLVVGSDKMGLAHPNWKQNHAFALRLNEALNLYYPGLSNGVIVSDARYNQHLSNQALIIEFGNQNSTLEEVYRSAEAFAEILALVLNQTVSEPITSTNRG